MVNRSILLISNIGGIFMAEKKFNVISIDDGTEYTCKCDEVSSCPICHWALVPQNIAGYYVPEGNVSLLELCPKCRNIFLVQYEVGYAGGKEVWIRKRLGVYPEVPDNRTISKQIKELSPKFASIYAQAEKAEKSKLTGICGSGYRKSLEFLVKDYLIYKFPSDEATIQVEPLSVSIRRIEDDRIRVLSERATWIGNDETHYVKKHENLDIAEMKRFIDAVLHYIESELSFELALSIQPQK